MMMDPRVSESSEPSQPATFGVPLHPYIASSRTLGNLRQQSQEVKPVQETLAGPPAIRGCNPAYDSRVDMDKTKYAKPIVLSVRKRGYLDIPFETTLLKKDVKLCAMRTTWSWFGENYMVLLQAPQSYPTGVRLANINRGCMIPILSTNSRQTALEKLDELSTHIKKKINVNELDGWNVVYHFLNPELCGSVLNEFNCFPAQLLEYIDTSEHDPGQYDFCVPDVLESKLARFRSVKDISPHSSMVYKVFSYLRVCDLLALRRVSKSICFMLETWPDVSAAIQNGRQRYVLTVNTRADHTMQTFSRFIFPSVALSLALPTIWAVASAGGIISLMVSFGTCGSQIGAIAAVVTLSQSQSASFARQFQLPLMMAAGAAGAVVGGAAGLIAPIAIHGALPWMFYRFLLPSIAPSINYSIRRMLINRLMEYYPVQQSSTSQRTLNPA